MCALTSSWRYFALANHCKITVTQLKICSVRKNTASPFASGNLWSGNLFSVDSLWEITFPQKLTLLAQGIALPLRVSNCCLYRDSKSLLLSTTELSDIRFVPWYHVKIRKPWIPLQQLIKFVYLLNNLKKLFTSSYGKYQNKYTTAFTNTILWKKNNARRIESHTHK